VNIKLATRQSWAEERLSPMYRPSLLQLDQHTAAVRPATFAPDALFDAMRKHVLLYLDKFYNSFHFSRETSSMMHWYGSKHFT
jgi:hypothetical protein